MTLDAAAEALPPGRPAPALRRLAADRVSLLPGPLQRRWELNRAYVLELRAADLLQNHYFEAGIWGPPGKPGGIHWGWESPNSMVRGHFLGHWLSAAAHLVAATGHAELSARAAHVVAELGRCQEENGGEWVGSIPAKYLERAARGRLVWAPQYVVHKTLMGLADMHRLTGNEEALAILQRAARWFSRWTSGFTRQEMDDLLDVETGGMLEVWADLCAVAPTADNLALLERYDRRRLFDRLLAGEDVLTNQHANTTIPEVLGAARAFEVTGEPRWRQIVEAYWDLAVTRRGTFCTGGQTTGEVWTPPFQQSARLGDKNQEHCTVYNMMRLAEWLLRWTGDAAYADYWERNLWNGVLAQQNHATGMVTYFLPLRSGSRKTWGSRTEDFWCCHGSLVQAHSAYSSALWYEDSEGLLAEQLIPSVARWESRGAQVTVTLREGPPQAGPPPPPGRVDLRRPQGEARPAVSELHVEVACSRPAEFALRLRIPSWVSGAADVVVDGERAGSARGGETVSLHRVWDGETVHLRLPRSLRSEPLPDRPGVVAFLDGPVVLAGLCDEERTLHGDPSDPAALLVPDNEREQGEWNSTWRATGQDRGLRFVPLHQVVDETYSVYFPVAPR